jgi:hypothetical protein
MTTVNLLVTPYKVIHIPLSKCDGGKRGERIRFCYGSKTNKIRTQKLRQIAI